MQCIHRFYEAVFTQHGDNPASHQNELRMLDPELAAIGQVESKWPEASSQSQVDLVHIHRVFYTSERRSKQGYEFWY